MYSFSCWLLAWLLFISFLISYLHSLCLLQKGKHYMYINQHVWLKCGGIVICTAVEKTDFSQGDRWFWPKCIPNQGAWDPGGLDLVITTGKC